MVYNSCFDIIGPIMVGPSSSHTAGVVTIGKFVHDFLGGGIESAEIVFYDSFSETHKGHGTDKAIVGGLLGLDTDDSRIRVALELAAKRGVRLAFECRGECPYYDHPNTLLVRAKTARDTAVIGGVSLGGGISKIFYLNDFAVDLPLNAPYDLNELRNKFWQKTRCEAVAGGA